MKLTIEEYCKKEKISRAAYYKRLRKGYISKDRLSRNDGNMIVIEVEENNK